MNIPTSLTVPGIGITTKMAGAPAWVVVLCVLTGALVALPPQVLAYRAKDKETTNIDNRRQDIVAVAASLPPDQCATALADVARGLTPQESPPPSDPSAPSRSP